MEGRDLAAVGQLLEDSPAGLLAAEDLAECERLPDRSAAAAAELFLALADRRAESVDALFLVLMGAAGQLQRVELRTGAELLATGQNVQLQWLRAVGVLLRARVADGAAARQLWCARVLRALSPASEAKAIDENSVLHKRTNNPALQPSKRGDLCFTSQPAPASKATLMTFFARKG